MKASFTRNFLSDTKTLMREKTNKCHQCDFATDRPSDLKRHVKAHSGEKSYKCEQCDFASVWAAALRAHLKIHFGE